MTDIIEKLQEDWLRLSRGSFDSVDCGLAANVVDEAIDEIKRLREELARSSEQAAYAPVEVWHGGKKVTVHATEVIRVWGPDIEDQMSVDMRDLETVQAAFDWLFDPNHVSEASYCVFCDMEYPLHEDAKGFHHIVKGEAIPCGGPVSGSGEGK